MGSQHHDTGYKELFSHPEFVQQLIDGFVPAEIANLMDFKSLQMHSGNYITPLFEEKYEDVVWSAEIRWKGVTSRVYLYILLEFQSSVDKHMPIRLLHYVTCFYDHLIDEGRYTDEQLAARKSPLSGIFGIEKASRNLQSLQQAVDRIVAIIRADPRKERTDAIVTRWLKRHLKRLAASVNLEQLNSLVEGRDMLAENLEHWARKERREARQAGLEEGLRKGQMKGQVEGERRVLQRQLGRRFGTPPDWVIAQLASATSEQLEAWADAVLTANTLDEVFERSIISDS